MITVLLWEEKQQSCWSASESSVNRLCASSLCSNASLAVQAGLFSTKMSLDPESCNTSFTTTPISLALLQVARLQLTSPRMLALWGDFIYDSVCASSQHLTQICLRGWLNFSYWYGEVKFMQVYKGEHLIREYIMLFQWRNYSSIYMYLNYAIIILLMWKIYRIFPQTSCRDGLQKTDFFEADFHYSSCCLDTSMVAHYTILY